MDQTDPKIQPQSWQLARIDEYLRSAITFRHVTIPYLAVVAIRNGHANTIVSARLTFASPTAALIERNFESPSLKAAAKPLDDLAAAERIICSLATGSFEFDGERYSLPVDSDRHVSVEIEPFHQGLGPQSRLCVLTLKGGTLAGLLEAQKIDWELKASIPPYLTLQELLLEYELTLPQGVPLFESVHAMPIVIDGERSGLNDGIASISVKIERGVDIADVHVGLVAFKAGEPTSRNAFTGPELAWADDGSFRIGSTQCEVPVGKTVQAIAALRGEAFHYWWLVDPKHIPNPRKAVYDVVDPGLAQVRDLITQPSKGASRDLESAVAWLLWMLGFSVAHLGSNRLTQDAVDLLVATPAGNFALVECTTGVISTDRKVPNLLRRRTLVNDSLTQSNHNAVRVLPILVTSCSREEVEQEIGPAQARGVLVLTRGDLEEMLNQTHTLMDPDEIYRRAEEQVASAADTQQTNLPGIG